jgi:hypothetical protein
MRKIHQIAQDIKTEWGNKVYFGAKPYLDAMFSLEDKNSMYFMDSADSIVRYFLANASTFRGEKAKALKAELKQVIGMK